MNPQEIKQVRGRNWKKALPIIFGALIALLVVLLPNHEAHADGWSIFSLAGIGGGVIGWGAYYLMLGVTTVVGAFIAIITYLIAVILQLSNGIVNTLAVQSGFSVTLAVANLGFILGIIVIAIATILHQESYGIKKSLWKLVVAAILVNFSLVIGGVIINFANTITNTFLTSLPGGGGNNGPAAFANQLAGAFSPQRALIKNPNGTPGNGSVAVTPSQAAGDDIASVLTPLVNIVAAGGFLIVILITLSVFVVQLLVRYVALAILLVLMPFAWLMWLFPKTSHLWSKWWSEFIRWSFFSPIVIFFLWLAIATAQAMSNTANPNAPGNPLANLGAQYTATAANPVINGLSSAFGSFIGSFAGVILQGVIVIGFAIGGMMAADKFSIMGSKAAIGAATSVGNGVKDWSTKQAKKGARATYQRVGGEKLTQRLQTGRLGVLSKVPGVNRVAGHAGRGLANATEAGGKDLVAEAAKHVPEDMGRVSTELEGSMPIEKQFARLDKLSKANKLSLVKTVDGASLADFLDKNKKVFDSYNQKQLYGDLQAKSGLDETVRTKQKGLADANKIGAPGPIATAQAELATAVAENLKTNRDPDMAAAYMKTDTEISDIVSKGKSLPFGFTQEEYKALRESITAGIGKSFTPEKFSAFLGKLDKVDQLDGYLDKIKAQAAASAVLTGTPPQMKDFFSGAVEKWIANSPAAQNFGIDKTRLGIP